MIFAIFIFLFPILWIAKLFIYEPIKENQIFKLFKIRSQISLEAMKGNIEETDESYRLLMYLINSEIAIERKGSNSLSIVNYVENIIAAPVENECSDAKFENLINKEALFPYTVKVAKIVKNRIDHRLRLFKVVIVLTYIPMCIMDIIMHHNNKISKKYKTDKLNECNKIKKKYSEYLDCPIT